MDENRPASLTVMAEYGVGIPVWDRPTGSGYPFDPSRLRVPGELVEGLRRWNDRYELLALTAFRWESAEVEDAQRREGRDLTRALQRALPDVEVLYFEDRPAD